MFRYFIIIVLGLALFSCKSLGKLSGKEKRELARVEREKAIADSLATVARLESLAKAKELARKDSIRVADSLAALPPPINYDTVFVASLLRTPCYGACPHYEIRLYASGYATFEGLAHVKKLGRYEARLDTALVSALKKKAKDLGYMNFLEQYPQQERGITDFPLCVSSFFENNEKKVVYNRNDAPINLVRYEQFFDDLFEEVEWILIKK